MNEGIIQIPVDKIWQHPDNPRKDLGDLTELTASIKANGILQNLTVVPLIGEISEKWDGESYRCLIGHRRLAAAKLAGLMAVPCVITEMTPREQVQTMLLENMQRSDLTVYEQAQGFQMMLDFGATVEEIAEKSGFSPTTVRRRVKMMELDQKTLKTVSARQLCLSDFDALAQIEDVKKRNEVLKDIGTREFDANLSRALGEQKARQNKPLIEEWLRSVGAKELAREERWSAKYETYPGCSHYIYFSKWGEPGDAPPANIEGEIFYYMDSNSITLYRKTRKAKPEKKKKTPKEQARESLIREAWKSLEDSASLAFDLRRQFIEKLTVTGKNKTDILFGALVAGLLEAVDYNSPDRTALVKQFDIAVNVYDPARSEKLAAGIGSMRDDELPALVYAMFGDSARELCVGPASRSSFPEYKRSVKLDLLYDWLARLGYEMSTEEMQLLNGEHAGYHAEVR